MHQILFPLQLRPRAHWGSLQHYPDLLAGCKQPTSKAREGWGRKGMGREGKKGKGVEGMEQNEKGRG